jgi:hypothetical protein
VKIDDSPEQSWVFKEGKKTSNYINLYYTCRELCMQEQGPQKAKFDFEI